MKRIGHLLLSLLLLALFFLNGCGSGDEHNRFLDDRAHLLSNPEAEHLKHLHKAMLEAFDVHFKVITLEAPAPDLNQTAIELFQDLGKQTGGAKGLLFVVDPIGQQVRIEVGYDLEPLFPDIFISYLENKQMLPFFSGGRVGHGIEATSELLITRLQRAMAGNRYDPEVETGQLDHYSGGGGAKIAAAIGHAQPDKQPAQDSGVYTPQDSPEATLAVYKQVLANHIKDPNLTIFTPETRNFFSNWVVTDAQQNNELRSLSQHEPERVIVSGDLAVVRYKATERTQPPYFLQKSEDGWMLDFSTMSRVLQMNHKNMWHFRTRDHDYMFGFEEWEFDGNGFPRVQ